MPLSCTLTLSTPSSRSWKSSCAHQPPQTARSLRQQERQGAQEGEQRGAYAAHLAEGVAVDGRDERAQRARGDEVPGARRESHGRLLRSVSCGRSPAVGLLGGCVRSTAAFVEIAELVFGAGGWDRSALVRCDIHSRLGRDWFATLRADRDGKRGIIHVWRL